MVLWIGQEFLASWERSEGVRGRPRSVLERPRIVLGRQWNILERSEASQDRHEAGSKRDHVTGSLLGIDRSGGMGGSRCLTLQEPVRKHIYRESSPGLLI